MLDFEPFDELPAEHQIGLMLLVSECCHVLAVRSKIPSDHNHRCVFAAMQLIAETGRRVTWVAIAETLRQVRVGPVELGMTAWDSIGVAGLYRMACNVPDSLNGYLRSLCEHVYRESVVEAGF